jgi:hypothetical protein
MAHDLPKIPINVNGQIINISIENLKGGKILGAGSYGFVYAFNGIDKIVMKRPDDSIIQSTDLESWICMKRVDIIKYLSSLLNENELHYNRNFSHFIYENDKAIAVQFLNGDIEYGDVVDYKIRYHMIHLYV